MNAGDYEGKTIRVRFKSGAALTGRAFVSEGRVGVRFDKHMAMFVSRDDDTFGRAVESIEILHGKDKS